MGKEEDKKKVLVVIAHPDDETIWMGGTLLKNKNNWKTTIISLCRKYDPDRAPKFENACQFFNAKCFMSDLEDDKLMDIPLLEAIKMIKKYSDKNYDYIFTHGKKGEYGHKRHIDVHKAVLEMIKNKMLFTKQLFLFSYQKKMKGCYACTNADKFIKLNQNQFKLKKKLIREVYGFQKGGFEDFCCSDLEAFNVIKINK